MRKKKKIKCESNIRDKIFNFSTSILSTLILLLSFLTFFLWNLIFRKPTFCFIFSPLDFSSPICSFLSHHIINKKKMITTSSTFFLSLKNDNIHPNYHSYKRTKLNITINVVYTIDQCKVQLLTYLIFITLSVPY